MKTGIQEFDRVLGGGIVPSSLVLIGGDAGIGKSTLILKITETLPKPILYVSGEESGPQIKMRANRLGLLGNNMEFLGETILETILATISSLKPKLTIIDSIQTIFSNDSPSDAGSANQIRVVCAKLLETAKKNNTAIFIIGHITKEGIVSGPKTLEHLVDTVVYLEGDRYHSYRILRAVKNRFGSTNEVGIFEMRQTGLEEVKNPSTIFLSSKIESSGSVITATIEGTRVFLAEVQALVAKTNFGYPRRYAQGFDLKRLNLLSTVLQKRIHIPLDGYDIHINIAGGFKITEPAADLAVCLAILSAFKNSIINSATIVFGEVGLGGEVRSVHQTEKRIAEAEKFGCKKIIMPKTSSLKDHALIVGVDTIHEAIEKVTSNT